MTAADFFLLTTLLTAVATVVALIYAHQEHEQALEQSDRADRLSADLRAKNAVQARQRKAAPTFTVGAACNLNTQLQKPGTHAIPGSILSLPRHTVTPSQFSRN